MPFLTPDQIKLIEDNINFAYHMAHKLKNHSPIEFDDLFSLCFEGLIKTALTYDAEKSKFATYATRVISNHVFMENRRYKKRDKEVSFEDILFDVDENLSWENLFPSDELPLDDRVVGEIMVDNLLAKIDSIIDKFPNKQRTAARIILSNPSLTQREISDLSGTNQTNVCRAEKRLREQVKKELVMW